MQSTRTWDRAGPLSTTPTMMTSSSSTIRLMLDQNFLTMKARSELVGDFRSLIVEDHDQDHDHVKFFFFPFSNLKSKKTQKETKGKNQPAESPAILAAADIYIVLVNPMMKLLHTLLVIFSAQYSGFFYLAF